MTVFLCNFCTLTVGSSKFWIWGRNKGFQESGNEIRYWSQGVNILKAYISQSADIYKVG
jgi:hypothetical protein